MNRKVNFIKKISYSTSIAGLSLVLSSSLISCANSDEPIEQSSLNESHVQSTEINLQEAERDLLEVISKLEEIPTRNGERKHKVISNSFTLKFDRESSRSTCESQQIYVFNFAGEEGYAIMSGDTRVPSLIALSDNGVMTRETVITDPGVIMFLEKMEDFYTVQTTPASNPNPNHIVYGEWKTTVYNENGTCPVAWGQDSPYNKYCPLIDGKPTCTGCSATALAQLMAIYKYPSEYNGYSFSWDEMTKNRRAYSCPSSVQDQIARLIQQLGLKKNLDMTYNTAAKGGSGAKAENIKRTLKGFGFSHPGLLSDYNKDVVVNELKSGYGVLLSGYAKKKETSILGFNVYTAYSGGHMWLAHGVLERQRDVKTYNSEGKLIKTTNEIEWYLLCNWGWDGFCDGYYLSDAFDANNGPSNIDNSTSTRSDSQGIYGSDDYNYQYNIRAVTDIRK